MNQIKKADIGIIGAMQIEVEAICAAMENTQSETVGNTTFVYGDLLGKKVVCAKCGIGKVFAAMCTQTMILRYAPGCIINSGVAGTLSDTLSIGQIALADQVVQHDMDTSPIGDPVGLISGINVIELPADKALGACVAKAADELGIRCVSGVIASGDQFVSSAERKRYIVDNFGAIACEMEGASIAQVCYVNRVRYVVIRAISDSADGSAHMDYGEFVKIAAANSAKILCRMLEAL